MDSVFTTLPVLRSVRYPTQVVVRCPRQAVARLDEAGLDLDDLPVHPDRDRGFPFSLAQGILQVLQDEVIEGQPLQAVVVLEELSTRSQSPVSCRGAWGHEVDVVLLHRRVQPDGELLGCLAHHLLACARPFGHEDLDVAVTSAVQDNLIRGRPRA